MLLFIYSLHHKEAEPSERCLSGVFSAIHLGGGERGDHASSGVGDPIAALIIRLVLERDDKLTLCFRKVNGDFQGTLLLVTATLALWNAAIVPATLAHG